MSTSVAVKLLVVWVTTRCQLRCPYCYMGAGDVAPVDLDAVTFRLAADKLGLGPGAEVQIAGGEPLLVPQLVDAVATYARQLGVTRIGVQTNGLAIDDACVALIKRHRLAVGVSIDGPPAVNDRLRGRSADVLRGLAKLEAESIPFGVTAVVSRTSVDTLADLGLLLAGFAQARSLGLDIVRPAGRASADDLPAPAALRRSFADLAQRLAWANRRRRFPLKLRELAAAGCGTSPAYCPSEFGLGAALTADGALYPCASLVGRAEYYCGTAAAPDFARLARGLKTDTSICGGCTVTQCAGRCPSLALLSPQAGRLDCALRIVASRLNAGAAASSQRP
jgi:uncharacterized protein